MNMLNLFIQKLKEAEVNHIIVRPINESDDEVDVYVTRENLPQAVAVCEDNFIHKLSFKAGLPGHVIYKILDPDTLQTYFFDLHCGALSYDGTAYLPESFLLENTIIDTEGNTILNQYAYTAMLILHSLFDKAYFKKKYFDAINAFLEVDSGSIDELLTTKIGPKNWQILRRVICERDSDSKRVVFLKYKLLLKEWWKQKTFCRFLYAKYMKLAFLLKQLREERGQITFIGTDGSGKSTIITALSEHLDQDQVGNTCVYMGWKNLKFPLFALLYKIFDKKRSEKQSDSEVSKKSSVKKSGLRVMLVDFVKSGIYLIEMYYRYLVYILPSRGLNTFTLTDRYVYDLFTFQLTYFKRLVLCFPRPSMVIYLHADAAAIQARKGEEAAEEILEQQKVYAKNLAKLSCDVVKVSTDVSVESSLSAILVNIYKYNYPLRHEK